MPIAHVKIIRCLMSECKTLSFVTSHLEVKSRISILFWQNEFLTRLAHKLEYKMNYSSYPNGLSQRFSYILVQSSPSKIKFERWVFLNYSIQFMLKSEDSNPWQQFRQNVSQKCGNQMSFQWMFSLNCANSVTKIYSFWKEIAVFLKHIISNTQNSVPDPGNHR